MISCLLSVECTFFSVLDYPLSYVEFFGTVFYLLSVYLVARRNVLTWPIGIISVLLFMVLFYQIRLYADAAEQIYYLAASIYGWWYWGRFKSTHAAIDVMFSPVRAILSWLGATFVLSLLLSFILIHVHQWYPDAFPEPASYPVIDALTTVTSLVAMFLMARKRTESWILWIAVDLIGIWLYFVKGVLFVSLLYVILLVLALGGLVAWVRATPSACSTNIKRSSPSSTNG